MRSRATTRRRVVPPGEVDCLNDLVELPERVRATQPVTVRHAAILEYSLVPGQDDSLLVAGDLDDFLVGKIPFPGRVEAEEPQVSRE